MRPLLLLTLMLSLLVGSTAQTQAQRPGGDSGWAEILDPDRRRARRRVREGLARLVRAMARLNPNLGDQPRFLILDGALLRFERAARVLPEDAELAYYIAYALTRWERRDQHGGMEYRSEEAIDAWHRLRGLDPSFQPHHVAYQLAMLHMRQQDFELARAEYQAALAHSMANTVQLFYRFYLPSDSELALAELFSPIDVPNMHGNLAEVLMLTGDVRGAIEHYHAAHDGTENPISRVLAEWGLALAYERADDHDQALAWADRAIRADPIPAGSRLGHIRDRWGDFAVLHLDFVFWEPRYEIHAYEAIGHEAVARREIDPEPDRLEGALQSWRLFLAEGGVSSRFGALARERITELETAVAELPEGRPTRTAQERRHSRGQGLPPVRLPTVTLQPSTTPRP